MLQIYRKAAKDAKWRKGEWVIEKTLPCLAFPGALCGFACEMTSDTFPLVKNHQAQSDKRWGMTA